MFSKLVLAGMISAVTSVSLAEVNLGHYKGQTESKQECSLELSTVENTFDVSVAFTEDSKIESCEFKATHARESKKELKLSGGHDTAVCKVKVALANDGTPTQAQIGVGQYFQFGFDVTCSNLQKIE